MESERPTPKRNNLFEQSSAFDTNSNKLSTGTVLFFKTLHVLLSWDLGFFSFKTSGLKIFFRVLSLCQCYACCIVLSCAVIFNTEPIPVLIWFTIYIMQYCISVTSVTIVPESRMSFKMFYDNLLSIDSKLMVKKSYRFEAKFFTVMLMPVFYRIVLSALQCGIYNDDCFHTIYANMHFFIIVFSMDVVLILNAFIYYMIYCRLITFKKVIAEKRFDLNYCQYLYKSLVDLAENIKKAFDSVFVVALLTNIPSITMMLFYEICNLKFKITAVTASYFVSEYFAVAQKLLSVFAPAILAGMLSSQANLLKVQLHNLMLVEHDTANSIQLMKFISYIEARPFDFYTYDIIPLNARLVSIVLNLCVTYLIVLIQLFHIDN